MTECSLAALWCTVTEPLLALARMALVDARHLLRQVGVDGWTVAALGWGTAGLLYLRLRFERLARRRAGSLSTPTASDAPAASERRAAAD